MNAPAAVRAELPTGLDVVASRLDEIASVLLPGADDLPQDTAERAAEVLRRIVTQVADDVRPSHLWLLLVALSGTFPVDDDVRAARRVLELSTASAALSWLLEWAYAEARTRESGALPMRLVRDAVVVDVDFTAQNDLQTGIQRVVRRLVPRWYEAHEVELAVWSRHSAAMRALDDTERARVLHWVRPLGPQVAATAEQVLIVPWNSTIVLPEVPGRDQCRRLTAAAQHSGNRVMAVGYDCIPVLSADLMPEAEPTRFVKYLSLVKHIDRIAAISQSAAEEFRGFCSALPAQGLAGPYVTLCPLATDAATGAAGPPQGTEVPEILVVGSHEPRKNHLTVLQAADVLWRQGMTFRLRFIGGSGWTTAAFDAHLQRLTRAGRPVVVERSLDDQQLWRAYRQARFTVFPSLHEGYGLPVVESLTLGTPVIGTDFGSIAELAADGGMLLVDPRDDAAMVGAMSALLTDDALLGRLRAEALARPQRTWDEYAAELWQALVVQP